MQERPRKRYCVKKNAEHCSSIEAKALNKSRIRIEDFHNLLIQKLRTDQGETSGKNTSEELVRYAREFAKSVTKTSSKVQKPKTYD